MADISLPAVRQHTRIALSVENLTLSLDSAEGCVDVSYSRISLRFAQETTVATLQRADPLVLDLTGDGVALAPPDADRLFDLKGNGTAVPSAWVQGDDALLALDRDGDGRITSGRELFGDQNGAADGFAELARLDANGDGGVDGADPAYRAGVAGGLLVARSLFERDDGPAGGLYEALFDLQA